MGPGTFYGMINATPDNFELSVKVPETVTYIKRLDVRQDAIASLNEFLDKISPLKNANKLELFCFSCLQVFRE
jgi:uncharacterized protein YecE (DUF72 family)